MRRLLIVFILLLGAAPASSSFVAAQTTPRPGDPPVLALISASAPDADGMVTIRGESGAVFPNAYVLIRNLYTGATVEARAGGFGGFTARIAGVPVTPYLIMPSLTTPPDDQPLGTLLGGVGAILTSAPVDQPEDATPTTRITIDGALADWDAYPDAKLLDFDLQAVYALRNQESLYVAVRGDQPANYAALAFDFTIDNTSYTYFASFDDVLPGRLARTNPNMEALGEWIAPLHMQGSVIEVRIPLRFVERADRVTLDEVRWVAEDDTTLRQVTVEREIDPRSREVDAIVRSEALSTGEAIPFTVAGVIGAGDDTSTWSAAGQVQTLDLTPGESWALELDVTMNAPNLDVNSIPAGGLYLQPITREAGGDLTAVGGVFTGNGWSGVITDSGLPIDGLPSGVPLGTATAAPQSIIRDGDTVRFPLDFNVNIPAELPRGLYTLYFDGEIITPEAVITWRGADVSPLPLVLEVGEVEAAHLPLALFANDPSDGARGLLPVEDQDAYALSNRVRFAPPTYILPPAITRTQNGDAQPIPYSLEPYLLNQLPNTLDTFAAPLIPLELPGGTLDVSVTLPNGSVDRIGELPIVQNRVSMALTDERALFDATLINPYQLTTLDPRLNEYIFDQYGEHAIDLTAEFTDRWGNTYTGGGEYRVLVAELLDLTPSVLPGTPFVVGDVFNPGVRVLPTFPADITITVRVFPVDGGRMIEQTIEGQANGGGYFQPQTTPFAFTTPGEYVIDYEARYTTPSGTLWAASLRSAGVIADVNGRIVAHGQRGLPLANNAALRPAWFALENYAAVIGLPNDPQPMYAPYHSGDVLWQYEGAGAAVLPRLSVQDVEGALSAHLLEQFPNAYDAYGMPLSRLAALDALPIETHSDSVFEPAFLPDAINHLAYTYISAVRPNVTVRQYLSGDDAVVYGWTHDDPHNRQIGAGADGARPGDPIFIFGGVVIKNPAAGIYETAIYSALDTIMPENDPRGARVYPPANGADGGAAGGAILGDQDTFIVLTSLQPGDVLTRGERAIITGQAAPPSGAVVTTTITAPSGRSFTFFGETSPIGYFYNPAHQFTVDETGEWTAQVVVQQAGSTSAGIIEPPAPEGGIPGIGQVFTFYVLPPQSEPLDWNPLLTDVLIPIGSPYNFSFTLPNGWTNIDAAYIINTAGYVIEVGEPRITGRSFVFTYTAPNLAREHPQLEDAPRLSGAWAADARTVTFVATGVDETGVRRWQSRTFTLFHDRLVTAEIKNAETAP